MARNRNRNRRKSSGDARAAAAGAGGGTAKAATPKRTPSSKKASVPGTAPARRGKNGSWVKVDNEVALASARKKTPAASRLGKSAKKSSKKSKAKKPVPPPEASSSDEDMPDTMEGERPVARKKKGRAANKVTEDDLDAHTFEMSDDDSSSDDDASTQYTRTEASMQQHESKGDSDSDSDDGSGSDSGSDAGDLDGPGLQRRFLDNMAMEASSDPSSGGDSESDFDDDDGKPAMAEQMAALLKRNGVEVFESDTDGSGSEPDEESSHDSFVVEHLGSDDDASGDDAGADNTATGTRQVDMFSSDDDSSEEEETGMERQSRLLNEEAAQEAADAEEEQQLRLAQQERYQLPTEAELEREAHMPPDLAAVNRRIQDVVGVLMDFRNRRDPDTSRSEYLDRLIDDISNYYGYIPELAELFLKLFPPDEALQFFDANETPRPIVIRTNTLKTRRRDLAQALINRGVNLDPLASWSKVGLKIYESAVPVGATPEYLSGQYMLQSAASFVPVMALAPKPGERVLDMCASPGGKSTYLAQLMRNKGVLVCNDLKKPRLHSLVANLARLGVKNAIVCNYDGRQIRDVMAGFDRILLDAPCTGLGVIARDPSIKTRKRLVDVQRMATLQRELALVAIDCINAKSPTGGYLVYSTCSVTVEENEAVVNYILKKRAVTLVPLFSEGAEDIGRPGMTRYQSQRFHPSLKHTRRFLPHVHNMDGFFVAKFKKYSNTIPTAAEADLSDSEEEDIPLTDSDGEEETKAAPAPVKKGKTGAKKGKTAVKQDKVAAKKDKKVAAKKGKKVAAKTDKVAVQQDEPASEDKPSKKRKSSKKKKSKGDKTKEAAAAAPVDEAPIGGGRRQDFDADEDDEDVIATMKAANKKAKKKARKLRRKPKKDTSEFSVVAAENGDEVGSGGGKAAQATAAPQDAAGAGKPSAGDSAPATKKRSSKKSKTKRRKEQGSSEKPVGRKPSKRSRRA